MSLFQGPTAVVYVSFDSLLPKLASRPVTSACIIFRPHMRGEKITGGIFTGSEADFGGFLYAEGDGITSCKGASIVKHTGVDGGAIYAVEDAVLDWACDLKENEALVGPAM